MAQEEIHVHSSERPGNLPAAEAGLSGPRSTLEILRSARELIGDPARWTKGMFARNTRGYWAEIHSEEAVCWCSIGAIARVCGGETVETVGNSAIDKGASLAVRALNAALPRSQHLAQFNDASSHEKLMARWDEAIAKLEGAGASESAKAAGEQPEALASDEQKGGA